MKMVSLLIIIKQFSNRKQNMSKCNAVPFKNVVSLGQNGKVIRLITGSRLACKMFQYCKMKGTKRKFVRNHQFYFGFWQY
jgi:hypothetical protein